MLVLSRKTLEEVVVNPGTPDEIRVTLISVDRNKVRLGFTAPKDFPILRAELLESTAPLEAAK